jgi:hypothetical protein
VKKPHVKNLIVGAAAVAAAGASSMTLFSTGVAGAAPDMTGKTFSEAQAALSQNGYTAVAQVAIGDKVPQSNCIVMRQQPLSGGFPAWDTQQTVNGVFVGGDAPTLYPNNPTLYPSSTQVLLTLSCYAVGDATQGSPTGSGDITTTAAEQQAAAAAAEEAQPVMTEAGG